jgi:hypothetical protein
VCAAITALEAAISATNGKATIKLHITNFNMSAKAVKHNQREIEEKHCKTM